MRYLDAGRWGSVGLRNIIEGKPVPTLELSFFGTCAVALAGPPRRDLRGAKHRALFALLATAPMGRRSRAYLQDMLWGAADYDSGHQNLRRALSDLRKAMGPDFATLLHTTASDVQLRLDLCHIRPGEGPFLHDLGIREPAFLAWRDEMRAHPDLRSVLPGRATRDGASRLRPRISALPLTVPDGDPALRVLGDWVAEEFCRALSRSNLLAVISHLSGRRMASRSIDIAEVRQRLDVDYLVTGALRATGRDIVCDFDFVDMASGRILWNRSLVCPAAQAAGTLPDRLGEVLRAIGRSVAETTLSNLRGASLPTIPDHEVLIGGISSMHRRTMRDFLNARLYLTEAAARAPHAPDAHAWLGKWHVLNVFKGYSTDRAGDVRRALDCTGRALDLDPGSSFALTIDGFVRANLLSEMDAAAQRYAVALDLNPNESLAWLLRGALLAFQDQGAAAVSATDTARRLSPIDPFGYYYDSLASSANVAAGNYATAVEYADRSLAANDRHISTLRSKLTAQYCLGDGDGARATGEVLRGSFPEFRIDEYRCNHPSAGNRTGRLVIEAMQAAGLP